MFEAQIPTDDDASLVETAVLQRLDWGDLVARLAASRDLHTLIARRNRPDAGNFARFAKVGLSQAGALNNVSTQVNPNKFAINPNILADGKPLGGNDLSTAQRAAEGDRE